MRAPATGRILAVLFKRVIDCFEVLYMYLTFAARKMMDNYANSKFHNTVGSGLGGGVFDLWFVLKLKSVFAYL